MKVREGEEGGGEDAPRIFHCFSLCSSHRCVFQHHSVCIPASLALLAPLHLYPRPHPTASHLH